MGDVLLVIIAIVGACTFVLAAIIVIRLGRIVGPEPLTKEIV